MNDLIYKLFYFKKSKANELKNRIKSEIRSKKNFLDEEEKKNAAFNVFSKIEQTRSFQKAKVILVYWSTPSELPSHEYIKKWSEEKTILVPILNGHDLHFKKYVETNNFFIQQEGVPEPVTEFYQGMFDLAIIPGIAFDKNKNRMGRGRGYYNHSLPRKKIEIFGVGYDFQILDKIPPDKGNMYLDKIFTPHETIV